MRCCYLDSEGAWYWRCACSLRPLSHCISGKDWEGSRAFGMCFCRRRWE